MEAATGLEPVISDLQSDALATWPCRLGEGRKGYLGAKGGQEFTSPTVTGAVACGRAL